MKKFITFTLIAALALTSAFAGITGNASFAANYDLNESVFTLDNSKLGTSTLKVDLEGSSAGTEAPESGIYADFKGSLEANLTEEGVDLKSELTEAVIKDANGVWSVDLTKVSNGVEVTLLDYVLDANYKDNLNWGIGVKTPSYTIVDGLTLSANATYTVAELDKADPANYGKAFGKNSEGYSWDDVYATYFATYDNGTYKNADLKAAQDKVSAAKDALSEAKAAFALDPSEENFDAITKKEEALKDAEDNLKKAEEAVEKEFKKANPEWYQEKVKYSYSEKWSTSTEAKTLKVNEKEIWHSEETTEADKNYVVVQNASGAYSVKEQLDPSVLSDTASKVVYTFTAKANTTHVYLIRSLDETTTYDEIKSFGAKDPNFGTRTLNGGLTLNYANDALSATLKGNVKYELNSKGFGFDVTANAKYAFVSGEVSFERTLDKENVLGASASATYSGVTATITGTDLLANKNERKLALDLSATVMGVSAKLGAEYNFSNNFHETGVAPLSLNAEMAYAFDDISVKASVTGKSEYNFNSNGDYEKAAVAVSPALTLENSTLIQNATLSLSWSGAKFGGKIDTQSKGALQAKAAIAF